LKLILIIYFIGIGFSLAQTPSTVVQSKEALLIANGDYEKLPPLSNPISDAKLLGETLCHLGFRVTLLTNASREDMLDAIQGLEGRLRSSHGIAFFHYGGHGIQVDGLNYLIPANANIPEASKLKSRAVDLDEVMTSLDEAGADVNIIVLDACRNNPLPSGTRSLARGLAVVQTKPKNSIIVYAADAGHEAHDGVFTPTLAKELMIPGISFQRALLEVRKQVVAKTDNAQVPADYSKLTEEIVLNTGESTTQGDIHTIQSSFAEMPPARVAPVVYEPVVTTATKKPSIDSISTSVERHADMPPVAQSQSSTHTASTGKSPEYVVLNYYRALNQEDFIGAWNVLPDSLQHNRKIHPEGFASFKSWFQGIVPISIRNSSLVEENPNQAIVDIHCAFHLKGRSSTQSLRYILSRDTARNRWEIKSVKINKHAAS